MFSIMFMFGLKPVQSNTVTFCTESQCFIFCELWIEAVTWWNRLSGTPKMLPNWSRYCCTVSLNFVDFIYIYGERPDKCGDLKTIALQTIRDIPLYHLLREVRGRFPRSLQKQFQPLERSKFFSFLNIAVSISTHDSFFRAISFQFSLIFGVILCTVCKIFFLQSLMYYVLKTLTPRLSLICLMDTFYFEINLPFFLSV